MYIGAYTDTDQRLTWLADEVSKPESEELETLSKRVKPLTNPSPGLEKVLEFRTFHELSHGQFRPTQKEVLLQLPPEIKNSNQDFYFTCVDTNNTVTNRNFNPLYNGTRFNIALVTIFQKI